MRIKIIVGWLVAVLILIQGCIKDETCSSLEGLNSYITDPGNGLVKESEVNGYHFKIQYRPTDHLVAQEAARDDFQFRLANIEELRAKYSPYIYMVLDISASDKNVLYSSSKGGHNFSDLLHKFAFRLNEYAGLSSSSGSEIRLVDFIYPRLFGASKSTSVLFVFEKANLQENDWVRFHLNEFGLGVGKLEFEFQTKDLIQSPNLQFN